MTTITKKMKNSKKITTIKKILVPIDYSECSVEAFKTAQSFAEIFLASIELLHVKHLPYIDENMTPNLIETMMEEQENYEVIHLQNFLNQHMLSHFQQIIRPHVMLGFASETILEFSQKNHIDIIIMGTQGENSMSDKLFGTISWNCLKNSEIPVFIIPSKFNPSNVKNILFPFEGNEADMSYIEKLLFIAAHLHATVHCVHFLVHGFVANKKAIDEMKFHFNHEIDEGTLVMHFLEEKNITEGISNYAKLNHIDMLSMVTFDRGFMATIFHMSISRFVASHFTYPLLAFRNSN